VWIKGRVDALVKAARAAYKDDEAVPAYQKLLSSIATGIRRHNLDQDESFRSKYRELIEYVEAAALDLRTDHELGFTVPDKQYFAETRQFVQIPEFLMDQRFLRYVSRYRTLDRAKAYLRFINSERAPSEQLLFFSYKSRHLGTPDNDDSFWRLLIVVPGDSSAGVPEKWVQFGLPDPKSRTHIRNVSVVSALLRSDRTFDTYFKDYFRTYRRNRSITIKGRWELGEGDDNCARCHKSGVLPIFPEANSVKKDELEAVSAVNNRFITYGSPRFGKYLDESKFGPGLSSATWESRKRRFGEGFDATSVGKAMSCSTCHRPAGLGALNWPMDEVVISSFISGGQMPLGYDLTAAEREELSEKLIQEYFATDDDNPGILKSWLLGRLR